MRKPITIATLAAGIVCAFQTPAEVLTNNGDSWVRENGPTTAFTGDLISVWNSVGGDRRYGVLSFDLGSLAEPISAVSLSLWSEAFGFSDDAAPLKQSAMAIDPAGIDAEAATWEQLTAAATLHTFEGLGSYDIGAPESDAGLDGVFLESPGTPADVAFLESVRTGDGTLMVLLIADEVDASNYKGSWGDGEFDGEDAVLKTNDDLEVNDDPNLAVDQALDFGLVTQGQGPFAQVLSIANTGAMEPLTVSGATIEGPNAAQFSVPAGSFPLQIDAGASAEIEITFHPGAQSGFFEATLVLASDDQNDAMVTVALSGTSEAPRITVINNGDSWVREIGPTNPFAGDLISVWNSTGGDLRYGVISFDLTSLAEPVGGVSLSLWSQTFGFSDDAVPLKQSAVAIDPTGIDPEAATWEQVSSAATLYTFQALGAVEIGAPGSDPEIDGVFIESAGSAADAAFVESVRNGSGTLMIVLIGEEDATSYRGSWGDGELGGEDAFLTFEPGSRPPLHVGYDPQTDALHLTWESKMGLLYNLRSETDLSIAPSNWPIFGGLENLSADPSGTNTETFPLPADPDRFFVIEQFPAPPETVFAENFDQVAAPELPAGWSTGADPLADTGTTEWELGPPGAVGPAQSNSSPNCVGTNLSAEYGFDTDTWLRTPPIDLTVASAATLTLRQFVDIEAGFDFGTVSVLNADDDSELAVLEETIDGVSGDWTPFARTLPAAAIGKTVKVQFRFRADDVGNFAGWYLDDVAVTVP